MKFYIFFIAIAFFFSCVSSQREVAKAPPVIDDADVLTDAEEARISSQIEELSSSIGAEIAVYTTTSLAGADINSVSLQKAQELGLGRRNKDDGLLFYLAIKEKEVRIEVGYGLESIIKDEVAAEIIRKQLVPYFKEGQFATGLERGIAATIKLIRENESLIGTRPQ